MVASIVFLPLIGAFIAGFFGRWIGDLGAQLVTCGLLGLASVLGAFLFVDVCLVGNVRTIEVFTWISSGAFDVAWSLRYDSLSASMVAMVTLVSCMIHIYSIGYMSHDPSVPRFMAYLSLFTFFMLALVTADNFLQLYFGWEGVGLCSYLLIGFWYDRPSANAAAIKAFVVNRVGDFGFALGIMGVFFLFDAVSFDTVFAAAPGKAGASLNFLGHDWHALTVICLLLFVGAMGKSAQLGLHTWLPDAMEGPTPVSALIHAATMVTAGVFMVCRLSPLFELSPTALAVVTIVGGSTAFFAATIGLVQNDIKRVIAYSTCSQLGYMFFAAGVSAYEAAMFHLLTHAFFKALLFLGAGSVIHAMSNEQDMRKMGGIWRKIPITYALMWIGSLALAGVPIFSGYYSKDQILDAAWAAGTGVAHFAFWLGIAASLMTAFYSWRLLFMTFHGKPRADRHVMEHVHESPQVMLAPLYVLAAGAMFAGLLLHFDLVGEGRTQFWARSITILVDPDPIEVSHHVPLMVELMPTIMAIIGIALAYVMYILRPEWPGVMARRFRGLYLFLLNKWYFDELYDWLFVRPAFAIGRGLWKAGDGAIIDGLGPDGFAAVTRDLARRAGRLQTGYVYHYAFAMLIGVVVLVSFYLYRQVR
ncbi:MAG: NADH-quinone oxidoreductase subunit L [Proteobacteria bacterium]|nr:NADH-quinone oxidoreductase subunit L [Pseudomonadota bacterium]MBI3498907.1 NADH-quinone oxidoreductase subunit L [Pseudomonadota bacterium]